MATVMNQNQIYLQGEWDCVWIFYFVLFGINFEM